MHYLHHERSGNGTVCGLPDGHTGQHLSVPAAERSRAWHRNRQRERRANRTSEERERMRVDAREYSAEYRQREEVRKRRRERDLRVYGITLEEYDRRLAEQDGTCAICDGPPAGVGAKNGWFSVDHDHETGKVRGLLCGSCNAALGAFSDDPVLLRAGAAYLEET